MAKRGGQVHICFRIPVSIRCIFLFELRAPENGEVKDYYSVYFSWLHILSVVEPRRPSTWLGLLQFL